MILTKEEILKLIKENNMISEFIDLEKQITENGFDVTVRRIFKTVGYGEIDFDNSKRKIPEYKELDLSYGKYILHPGSYIVEINEILNIPKDVIGVVYPRSSLIRMGCTLISAVWDAGYIGRGKLLLVCFKDVVIHKNARIGQMIFFKLTREVKGYNGTYQMEGIKRRN